MDVSIVIANWNTKENTRNCVESIITDAGNLSSEVIVVDNGSSDGSIDYISKHCPSVTIVDNHTNKGYASACNAGIKIAKGRYVLLLNSDIIIRDRAIEKIVRYADENPQAGLLGPKVIEGDDTVRMTCFAFPNALSVFSEMFGLSMKFKYNKILGAERMLWWDRLTPRKVDIVSGMFMLARADAIEKVGLMDEDYFLFYEESDWCKRFDNAGLERLFYPDAHVIHLHGGGQSRQKDALRSFVQFRKSLLMYFKKHHSLPSLLTVWLILCLTSILRAFIWQLRFFAKAIVHKDPTLEKINVTNYWWALKYCLFKTEPASRYE